MAWRCECLPGDVSTRRSNETPEQLSVLFEYVEQIRRAAAVSSRSDGWSFGSRYRCTSFFPGSIGPPAVPIQLSAPG
jgi:hypothetical protein